MKKVLIWADSPTATTGFARVTREIFTRLDKKVKMKIAWLGVNYSGKPHDFPFSIYPAQDQLVKTPDITGIKRLPGFIQDFKPDVIFILQDLWMFSRVESRLAKLKQIAKDQGHPFKIIYYFPVDGDLHKDWVDALDIVDVPITYTNWAKDKCVALNPNLKDKLKVIPHGVDAKTFYPIKKEKKDFFLFSNVGRNMQRKQLALSIMAFSKAFETLKQSGINIKLYLHCQPEEFGISLPRIAKLYGLTTGDDDDADVIFPNQFGFVEHKGISDEDLNRVYNKADCLISTTVGEGWGLPLMEAAACKTLLIVPEIQPLIENLETKAIFYGLKGSVNFERDLSIIRPLPNPHELSLRMIEVVAGFYDDKIINRIKERAYSWSQDLDWNKVFKTYWFNLLKEHL